MSLQDFLRDAKNIILGKIEEENQVDFKQELQNAIKEGKITKAEATLLIQSMNEVKADAKEMEKKQLSSISLEDGTTVSYEEAQKKKEELERKKRVRETQKRNAYENVQKQLNNKENSEKNKATNRLNIDKSKLEKAMERDERAEQNLNKTERDGKN